jgi:hypothetical protein
MNVFFLVEGRHTERKVYPKWINHLVPSLTKVERPALVKANQFCIVSGNGYPSILTYLENSVEEANRLGCFDFFIIVVDADDKIVLERDTEIMDYMTKQSINLSDKTELIIISQRVCIETWFLGNRKIFKRNVENTTLSEWILFYNVKTDDPEEMPLFPQFIDAIGSFHKLYFKKMMSERKLIYTEQTTHIVEQKDFLEQIIKRFKEGHIPSFGRFLDFCERLNP